jgi:hypothetical protein
LQALGDKITAQFWSNLGGSFYRCINLLVHQQKLTLPRTYMGIGYALMMYGAFILSDFVLVYLLFAVAWDLVLFPRAEDLVSFPGVLFVALLLIAIVFYVSFTAWLMLVKVPKIRLELTPQGVTLYHFNYTYYTPWQNITGIAMGRSGLHQWKGLQMLRPGVHGDPTRGQIGNMAVIELSWFAMS